MSRPAEQTRLAAKRQRDRKKAIINAYKAERGCADCGERDVRCLDLHHLVSSDRHPWLKTRNGRDRAQSWTALSYADLERELERCIVLCANCHRKRHQPQGGVT